jgi:hypothetical protein
LTNNESAPLLISNEDKTEPLLLKNKAIEDDEYFEVESN